MTPRTTWALLLVTAWVGCTGSARAESLTAHTSHIDASLGARVSKVADAGYDPFSSSDDLAQVSLGIGATVLKSQRFSLSGVGFWDYGGHSSTARSTGSELTVHRFTVGPELRYRVLPPFYVFLHALPAFAYSKASLDDALAETTRAARRWSYGVDGALGGAFELYAARTDEAFRARLLAVAEGGYGYLSSSKLMLKAPVGGGAPERTAPLDLGTLSLSGPYLRISAAVTF